MREARAQLYTALRRCVASCRKPLAGSRRFPQSCSNLPEEATLPCVGFANYPFVNLPPGNTLRCKLFPFDKFYKISLYFDGRIKYNEVNDKLEVFHELYWEVF